MHQNAFGSPRPLAELRGEKRGVEKGEGRGEGRKEGKGGPPQCLKYVDACSAVYLSAVTHPSTNRARRWSTSASYHWVKLPTTCALHLWLSTVVLHNTALNSAESAQQGKLYDPPITPAVPERWLGLDSRVSLTYFTFSSSLDCLTALGPRPCNDFLMLRRVRNCLRYYCYYYNRFLPPEA